MFIKTLLGQIPSGITVAFGACDQDLLVELLQGSNGRIIWLSPNEADSSNVGPQFWQASQNNRLLFLVGDPKGTLPALASQLAGQHVTVLLADQDGEVVDRTQVAKDAIALIETFAGSPPRVVLAVRHGEHSAERMNTLLSAVPEQAAAPMAVTDNASWLVAASTAGHPPESGPVFDMALVDEAEHLIPRPYGTLQTLNLDHLHRYALAKSFCYNANVLDAAMGCGYSSLILNCRHYFGVDIDANMVAFANQVYKPLIPNATYMQGSVLDLPVDAGSIDTFISFETIEHLRPDDLGQYFAEVRRVVRPNGYFLCSTPLYRGDGHGVLTRYHHFEFRYGHFESVLLGNGFDLRSLWYQWPPYYTLQTVVPSFEQTQQAAPVIVVAVCQVR